MNKSLRIFLCCQQDLKLHPVPSYRFWVAMFRAALAEAGHVCLEAPGCDWAEGLVAQSPESRAKWKESTWGLAFDWIAKQHEQKPIDLFLGYLYPDQIDPSAVTQIRDLGIPCVNFFCDNVRLFRQLPLEFRSFDLNWVPEAAGQELYRKAASPFIFAPMPCWVAPEWRVAPNAENLPPTFVGTRDDQRERLFAKAYQMGLNLELRGTGWNGEVESWAAPAQGKGLGLLSNQLDFIARHGARAFIRKLISIVSPREQVSYDFSPWVREKCQGDAYWHVLRETCVCIGVNRYPSLQFPVDRPDTYSRLRDLEGPMAGAAYLTEFAPELPTLYEIGTDIEVYRDASELVSKVDALTRDQPKRRQLRLLGQRRALSEHSVEQTIKKIAERLGILS